MDDTSGRLEYLKGGLENAKVKRRAVKRLRDIHLPLYEKRQKDFHISAWKGMWTGNPHALDFIRHLPIAERAKIQSKNHSQAVRRERENHRFRLEVANKKVEKRKKQIAAEEKRIKKAVKKKEQKKGDNKRKREDEEEGSRKKKKG